MKTNNNNNIGKLYYFHNSTEVLVYFPFIIGELVNVVNLISMKVPLEFILHL